MIAPEPCVVQPWWMVVLHESIGAGVLMTLGGIGLMLRLMWGDYRKKHHINGSDSHLM